MADHGTDTLLLGAMAGDESARQRLWERHRARLKAMVRARIDPFLATCLEPSDVVQDALMEASRKFPEYLATWPLPFYPWLRRLTIERLALRRRHHRERKRGPAAGGGDRTVADGSAARPDDRLAGGGSTLDGAPLRDQLRGRLLAALESMSAGSREMLILHYLEERTFGEIAAITGVAEGTIKVRHFRALARLRELLGDDPELALW